MQVLKCNEEGLISGIALCQSQRERESIVAIGAIVKFENGEHDRTLTIISEDKVCYVMS